MKPAWFFTFFLVLHQVFGVSAEALAATSAAPDPLIIDQENMIRKEAEDKIQRDILDKILGAGRATVMVNVEMALETEKKESALQEGKVEDKKGLGDQDYILPWVPAPKTVNKSNEVPKDARIESAGGEKAEAAVRQVVKRFDVTVLHDQDVDPGEIATVEETIKSAYVRFENILRVLFKPTRYSKDKDNKKAEIKDGLWDFLKPQNFIPALFSILLFFFLFFFLAPFLRDLLKAMGNRKAADMMNETLMKMQGENKNEDEQEMSEEEKLAAEEAALAEEEAMKKEQKFVPFAYIDDKNLDRLVVLLHRESPDMTAIILSYLAPELVKKFLSAMSPAQQAKVALHMVAVKQTTEAEIRALDGEVKAKIDFLVGGLPSLLKVLEDLDYTTRDNILEYLKNDRPNLYEKVRKRILVFEDVVNFPDDAMQLVVRELRAEDLARALQEASPGIREKFFKNMSKGAADLLKEEMEFGKTLTAEQIQEERQKILAVVKNLETQGRIKFRDGKGDEFLDWEDLDLMTGSGLSKLMDGSGKPAAAPAAPPADPAKAREYFDAGAALYNEQRYGEALPYFQYAAQLDGASVEIQQYLGNTLYAQGQLNEALAAFERAAALNPADESLKQWVEQFRASIATPAS